MTGFPKFVAVSGGGLLLDIALALFLHESAGMALWLAATISFFTVAVLNYFLFEFWIFAGDNPNYSWLRLAGVMAASVAAASTRVGTILGLPSVLTAAGFEYLATPLFLLICGSAVSVVVNFVINKKLIFG